MKVISRFAPSNTSSCDEKGNYRSIHLGNLKVCLASYLLAKGSNDSDSRFEIRIEDTDFVRSSKGSEDAILEGLKWLNIHSDAPIIRQSERSSIYKEHLDRLLAEKKAYYCYCTAEELNAVREEQKAAGEVPRYNKKCMDAADDPSKSRVVRLAVPDWGRVKLNDAVFGRILTNHTQISDPILQRSDGSYTFILTNTVDDCVTGATHVVRASEALAYAPQAILLYEALGYEPPTFVHVPLVVDSEGNRLSKRTGAKSLLELRDEGYLPEAVLNTVARLGNSYGTKEILSLEDLIAGFSIKSLNKSSSAFDPQKLLFLNSHWIKTIPAEEIGERLVPFLLNIGITEQQLRRVHIPDAVRTLQTRAKTLVELAEKAKFYYVAPEGSTTFCQDEKEWLSSISAALSASEQCSLEWMESVIHNTGVKHNVTLKQLGPVLRLALTGQTSSPPIVDVMHVLGITETIRRINKAISS